MGGGVSGYAAISARVRAMYADLLSPQDIVRLSDTPDFSSLFISLKGTAYGPYLDGLKDKDINPRQTITQIKRRVAKAYYSVVQMSPIETRPLIKQLYRYFEIGNLKAVLRSIVAVQPRSGETSQWDRVRDVLFPLGADTVIPAQAMVESGSITTAVELWAVRYKVYHKLSEEEIINYTLPFGYHVRDSDIRAIAAGADIASTVSRLYPEIPDVNTLLEEPKTGLPKLEVILKRALMKRCMAAFVGSPFHIGIPLAFLVMSDLEAQDLIVLIEAKSTNLSEDDYRPFLLKTSLLN